jgi:hypothetical protein
MAWVKFSGASFLGTSNIEIIKKGNMQLAAGDNRGWSIGYSTWANDRFLFDIHHYTDESNKLKIQLRTTVNPMPDNKWFHVAGTRTTSGADSIYTLYVNGAPMDQEIGDDGGTNDLLAADKAIDDNNDDFMVGSVNDLEGIVSDAAYYKKGLTQREINLIYQAGGAYNHLTHPQKDHLKVWWRMGDGDGDSNSEIKDISGNGYHGTMNGCVIVSK